MKRTLFGALVMSFLVGLGSFGVYYAQQKLAPKAVAAASPEEREPDESRDLTPIPIPIANHAEQTPALAPADAPGAGNPFAGRAGEREEAVADRYQTTDDRGTAVDEPAAGQPREIADDSAASEIPNADQVAGHNDPTPGTPEADPYSEPATNDPSRYAAQPAAAEAVDEPQAEPAVARPTPKKPDANGGEPRRLAPADSGAQNDANHQPPGNPLRGQTGSRDEQQPAEKRYAAEEFPDAPAADQPRNQDSHPRADLIDDTASFAQPGSNEGTGRPGEPQLSGAQSPALVIEKTAPAEIQIGKPAKFVIKVANSGTVVAQGVTVHDVIPRGTQLLDTSPPAKRGADGTLVWELGSLKPGDAETVELQLMPTAEGEIGSVATVHFHAEASVRTVATKPMLNIEVFGPSKVNKGDQLVLRIKLSNPGSGAATGILMSENVPQGLAHEAGKELEVEVGTLGPGEARELDLTMATTEARTVTNVITAKGDGTLHSEARTEVEIVAPQLQVAMSGPKRRYLERNATHSISITNPGTASAKDIDLVAVLPRTLKFVEANNGGQFDEATHAVYWSLEELPPQQTGTVKLTTLPLEAGEARLLIKSTTKNGLKDEREEVVSIEGLAAINFQLSDVKDPIEVGAETAYEIRVTNQGSKAASNVRLAALVPRGMKPLSAEGPVRYKIEGQHVLFEPLRQLAPKADALFTIKMKALESGDQRVEVQVATDEIRDPISKEESTRVFGDE
ncbi:MAG: hypothetical protein WD063_10800 [Pirellulales bacterium]